MTTADASAHDHYETLLADRYAWMLGDETQRIEGELHRLQELGVPPAQPQQTAVDLGCGTGHHSKALLKLGYQVTAVDQSPRLLAALADQPIRTVEADLTSVDVGDARVVACMGDTLPHLADWSGVEAVLARWTPGRVLALSFRDLTRTPTGLDRFFEVRSDADRIHTCFLEDAGGYVRVHDLFHERTPDADGAWVLRKSAYLKLRIDPERVVQTLQKRGAQVRTEVVRGMHYIAAM